MSAPVEISRIIGNIVSRMESITCATAIGGNKVFTHVPSAYTVDDLADSKGSRRFVVALTGGREHGGLMGQVSDMYQVDQEFEIGIAYRQGRSALALIKLVAEDVDAVALELTRNDAGQFDATNTGIVDRQLGSYSPEFDEASGGVALVRIPITCRYTPTIT
jgi:hypothetical protein